jgi:hypothetical protein
MCDQKYVWTESPYLKDSKMVSAIFVAWKLTKLGMKLKLFHKGSSIRILLFG